MVLMMIRKKKRKKNKYFDGYDDHSLRSENELKKYIKSLKYQNKKAKFKAGEGAETEAKNWRIQSLKWTTPSR